MGLRISLISLALIAVVASVWLLRSPVDTPPPFLLTGPWQQVEETTASGQKALLLLPVGHDPSKPSPLVIYHHGAGEGHDALIRDKLKADIVRAILAEGWLLAGCEAHGENWGRPEAVGDYVDLYEHVRSRHAISAVLHLSQSMGGLSGLQTVASGKVPAAGWAGIYPVCSIDNLHSLGRFAPAIEAAHGGKSWAAVDPVQLPPEAFRGVPMRFYASYGETVVPRGPNSDAMAARVGAGVVSCEGDHGHPSHFQSADLMSFFRKCLVIQLE